MVDSELQVGIAYALLAGVLWGIGPLLLKRALKHTDVSTATLLEQNVSVLLLVGLAIHYGEIRHLDFTSRAFWAFFLAGAVGASFGKVFKASVYGVLIALSGCLRGIQCGNSSSAVGDAATSAVVTGIVAIVVACGIFAVVFYVLGI